MSRLKRGERRDFRLPKKKDTPLKTTLRRRAKGQRFVADQRYEALPEEAEVEQIVTPPNPLKINLSHYKASRLHGCRSGFIGDSGENAALPGAPSFRKISRQVSPAARTQVQMEQNPSVISGSTTLLSLDSDVINSEDQSSSAVSNSLPSPESFRKERSTEASIFSYKEEIPAVFHNKNSTLLDVSHAVSIHRHPAPNLSTISDNSAFWPGNNVGIKYNRENEPEVRMDSSISSGNKVVPSKTAVKLTKRMPILFKKKVWFKNPLTESKHTPAGKLPLRDSKPFQTSSSVKNVKPKDDMCKESQMDSEKAVQVEVKQKRLTTTTPERAKLFEFSSDSDGEAFFQWMREKCDKLWSYPLFPLAAGNNHNCLY